MFDPTSHYGTAVQYLLLARLRQSPHDMRVRIAKLAFDYGVAVPVIAAVLEVSEEEARELVLDPTLGA